MCVLALVCNVVTHHMPFVDRVALDHAEEVKELCHPTTLILSAQTVREQAIKACRYLWASRTKKEAFNRQGS